jgi:hypothetical protein
MEMFIAYGEHTPFVKPWQDKERHDRGNSLTIVVDVARSKIAKNA